MFNKLLKKNRKGSYNFQQVESDPDAVSGSRSKRRALARKSFDPRDLSRNEGGYSLNEKSKLSLYNEAALSSDSSSSGINVFLSDRKSLDRNGNNKYATTGPALYVTATKTPPDRGYPTTSPNSKTKSKRNSGLTSPGSKRRAPAPPPTPTPPPFQVPAVESTDSVSVTSGATDPVFSSPSEDEATEYPASDMSVGNEYPAPLPAAPAPSLAPVEDYNNRTLEVHTTPVRPSRPPALLPKPTKRRAPSPLVPQQRRSNSQVHSTVITSSSSTITIQIKGRESDKDPSSGNVVPPPNCRLDVKYVEEEEGQIKESGVHESRRSLDRVPHSKPTPPPRRSRSRQRLPVEYITESMSVDSADSSDPKFVETHPRNYENFTLPGSVTLRNSPVLSDFVTTEDEDITSSPVEKFAGEDTGLEADIAGKTLDDYLNGYTHATNVTALQDVSSEQVVPKTDGHQLLSEIQQELDASTSAVLPHAAADVTAVLPNPGDYFDVDDVVEEGPGPVDGGRHLSTPGTSTPVHPRAVPRRTMAGGDQPLPVYDLNSDITYTVNSDVSHALDGDVHQNRTRVQYENVNITTKGVSYTESSHHDISQTVSSKRLSDVITQEHTSQQSTYTAHYVNQKDTTLPLKTYLTDDDLSHTSLPGPNTTTHSVLVEEDYVPNTPEISALTFLQSPTKEGMDIEKDLELPGPASYPWEHKAVHTWDSDDIIEWCQAKDLDLVAEKIQGVLNNGSQLLQLNIRDLDILQITDPDIRQRLLGELQSLQDISNTSPSLCRLQRVSVRRKTLEFSGDLIRQRLYNLQKLNEKQKTDIDSSLSVLQEEQRSTEDLLRDLKLKQELIRAGHLDRRVSSSVESLTVTQTQVGRIRRHSSLGDSMVEEIVRGAHKNYPQLPLTRWNNADVVHWLGVVGLGRFIPTFQEHNVCGRNLAEVNMVFLDDLNIRTVADRELLLSKLYELQHPQGPSLQDLLVSERGPASPSPSPSSRPELHRGLSVQPGEQAMALKRTKDTRLAHSRRSNTLPDDYESQSHEGDFSRQVERSMEDKVHVWHDLRGKLVCHPVTVKALTSAGEVVERLLKDNDVTDDPHIYYIVICDDAADGMTKEIRSHESPLPMYMAWSQDSTFRFELRMRITSTIRVVCHVTDAKTRGKVIKISTASTCNDVLKTAARKFRMNHIEMDPFCLLEVHPATGVLRQVDPQEVMYELHSDAFIFCNLGNRQKMLTAPTIAALREPTSPTSPRRHANVDREGSFLEKAEKQSRLSLPAPPGSKPEETDHQALPLRKFSSSDFLHRVSPNKQKLPSTDEVTKRDTDFAERLELLRELALMKDSMKERDINIELLMQENRRLKDEASSVRAGDLRRSVSAQNVSRLGNRDGTLIDGSSKEGIDEIRVLSKELYDVTIAVQNQEDTRLSFSKDLERADQNGMGPKRQEQLKRALASIEVELLTLKTRQAQVFAQLEVVRNNADKKKEPVAPDTSLYGVLRDGPPQLIVTAQLDTAASALGFLAGRDENNRHVIKHVEDGRGIHKNDRLLEVNGTMVFAGTDIEVQQAIKNAEASVKIVVLRDNDEPITSASSNEELSGLKEDLSLAMMEVESLTQDNQDLTREMAKMRQFMDQLREDNEKLLSEREKLKVKVSNSDVQWHELRTVLRKMQDGNLDPSELDSATRENYQQHDYRSANGVAGSGSPDKHASGIRSPMAEILQVLKDHIIETKQQRAYLSSLMSLVVAHAPHLILKVDQESRDSDDLHLKKRSEEFC